jgi:hypothetical protein
VPAGGDRLAHVTRPVGLDHGGGGIVHAHHHRGGPARAGQSLDRPGGGAQALATPTHLAGADQAEQASLAEGVDRSAREAAVLIDLDGGRLHHLGQHGRKVIQVRGHDAALLSGGRGVHGGILPGACHSRGAVHLTKC